MNKDWFPFFSMLLWFVCKATALSLLLFGFVALISMLATRFEFWSFLFMAITPMAVGYFLLVNDVLYELGTAARRRSLSKDS